MIVATLLRTKSHLGCYRCLFWRAMSSEANDDVLLEQKGNKGIISLNRAKVLNVLNLPMIRKIYPKLQSWNTDPNIRLIVIKGAGEKAFCAGGDIRAIAEAGKIGDPLTADFFREEYQLNNFIGALQVPYVALLDGITMGGGVGLSIHGAFRVATERTVFAMPETAIGFFPDVGGSFFLPRLQGKLGLYLALTGYRLTSRDVLKARLATHFVTSALLPSLEEDLTRLENPSLQDVDKVLLKYHEQCELDYRGEFVLKAHLGRINSLFDGESVEHILDNLKKEGSDWSRKQMEILEQKSPTSLKVTFRQLQEGSKLTLPESLKMEYRLCQRFVEEKDFYEGVRAVIVDKDNRPKWNPSSLNEVTKEKVDSYFAPLPGKELGL